MCNFRQFLENTAPLSPATITHWAKYASRMVFATPEEAREWILHKLEMSDREPSAVLFGVNGTEKNKFIANSMPLYQSGKSWKIGKRIQVDRRLRLAHLQVKKPSLEYLDQTANANTEKEFRYAGIKWVKISDLIGDGKDMYSNDPRQIQYIQRLAEQIKTNKWIEAVIVGQEGNQYELWEGQHRTRAMKLLGFSTVPAFIVLIEE